MRQSVLPLCLSVLCLVALSAAAAGPGAFLQPAPSQAGPLLPGGDYLGQKPPGEHPELFAPGIVDAGMYTRDVAMTPDGKEIYWTASIGSWTLTTVVFSKLVDGHWTPPEVAPFASDPRVHTIEPCISPDGKLFFFSSDRPGPQDGKEADFDLYVMERRGDGWSEPLSLGAPINTEHGEYFPSVTRDGTLYFTRDNGPGSGDIWRTRWVNGHYAAPEKLPYEVNRGVSQFNAFVAPDESYVILSEQGQKANLGSVDYYIVFRNPDDTWTDSVNLGPAINGKKSEGYSAFVSRDGKFLFFSSARVRPDLVSPGEKLTYARLKEIHNTGGNGTPAIYWMDAGFLKGLNPTPPAETPAGK
jgi:hypothetical protein